jgi:putative membrane protein
MSDEKPTREPISVSRSLAGGFLMGLANLVPGISGGTMILAVGLYDRFIGSVADVTRLRITRNNILFLGLVGIAMAAAIVGLSGIAVSLVSEKRWIMYSLFVGLTLGGVPELLKLCRPISPPVIVAILAGIAALVGLEDWFNGVRLPQTMPVLTMVGAAAAASMILPGVSGSTVLLILGMYELVWGSLSLSALREDPAASLRVLGPVMVGAALGIAVLCNVLKVLLARFPTPSHGALLGLLLGSVYVLWPFQEPVHADLANRHVRKATVMILAGTDPDEVRAAHGDEFDDVRIAALRVKWDGRSPADLKVMGESLQRFRPTGKQIGSSLVLLALGFVLTRLLGRRESTDSP